ncbi:hypothetical protein CBS101457_003083 [Exobasidium rhododendri]|nr:hypothetical protein CBS101457_003083 [Exobasidium rhododendri]
MSNTTSLPTNELGQPPKTGQFQLVVHLIAKDSENADKIYALAKAIQKRALSDEEPKTIAVSV